MEDTQIIGLYVSRQESAIMETSKKYGRYLTQVAYNILCSHEDTEEIVSDTYLAAWNAIPPQIPQVLRHFLSRITRNLSFDRMDYRLAGRRNGHMTALLSELEECVPDLKNDLEAILEAKTIGAVLNQFLSEQSRENCALFLERYYYSMTVAQIGRRHAMTEGVVKYRLSLLRKKLRENLNKEGITV